MPIKPGRTCPGRGLYIRSCPNVVIGNNRYCSVCSKYAEKEQRQSAQQYDQARDQSRDRRFIHSVQWRKIRLRKLAHDPLCEVCLDGGKEVRAVLVHHIDGDELNNNVGNHQSLCNDCHEKVHKKERWKKV